MEKKKEARPRVKRAEGIRTVAALRAEVHAACWKELTEALGEGRWKTSLPELGRIVEEPSEAEEKANELFVLARRAMIDVVVFAKLERDALMSGNPTTPGRGNILAALGPQLEPLLEERGLNIPAELTALLRQQPIDRKALRRASERAKKNPTPPDMVRSTKRSRLMFMLDNHNLLGLPHHENDPLKGSRLLTAREFALVVLLLNAGVLDEPSIAEILLRSDAAPAKVIREEEKRMRQAMKRHGFDKNPLYPWRGRDSDNSVQRGPAKSHHSPGERLVAPANERTGASLGHDEQRQRRPAPGRRAPGSPRAH